jgi:hypothetical protein
MKKLIALIIISTKQKMPPKKKILQELLIPWMAQIQRHQGDYVGSEATAVEALLYIPIISQWKMEHL